MAELVDAGDLKSLGRKPVQVQVLLPAFCVPKLRVLDTRTQSRREPGDGGSTPYSPIALYVAIQGERRPLK